MNRRLEGTAGKFNVAVAAALAVLVVFAAALPAAPHPGVQVEVRITDQIYARELGTQKAAAEQAVRGLVIDQLRNRIGFLDFTPEAQNYRLVVELGDGLRTLTHSIREVPFRLTLFGPDIASGQEPRISWVFRQQQDSIAPLSHQEKPEDKVRDVELIGVPGPGGAPGELRRQFAAGDFNALVKQLLSRIPVATAGSLREGPPDPLWEVPLRRGENCMDLHSRFLIANILEIGAADSEELPIEVEAIAPLDGSADALDAPIRARLAASDNQDRVIARLGRGRARVARVYVTLYRRRDVGCASAVPPADSELAGGGGQ